MAVDELPNDPVILAEVKGRGDGFWKELCGSVFGSEGVAVGTDTVGFEEEMGPQLGGKTTKPSH